MAEERSIECATTIKDKRSYTHTHTHTITCTFIYVCIEMKEKRNYVFVRENRRKWSNEDRAIRNHWGGKILRLQKSANGPKSSCDRFRFRLCIKGSGFLTFLFIGLTRNEETFTQRMRVGICCTQKPHTTFVVSTHFVNIRHLRTSYVHRVYIVSSRRCCKRILKYTWLVLMSYLKEATFFCDSRS